MHIIHHLYFTLHVHLTGKTIGSLMHGLFWDRKLQGFKIFYYICCSMKITST